MSYVIATPEALLAAASDVAGIGSSIQQANAAAASRTTGLLTAAQDEVSTAIAALFSDHAQAYQAVSAEVAAFHSQFLQTLSAGANSYALAEATNASPLQAFEDAVLGVINAPTEAFLGRPLIGNGANGARRDRPAAPAGC